MKCGAPLCMLTAMLRTVMTGKMVHTLLLCTNVMSLVVHWFLCGDVYLYIFGLVAMIHPNPCWFWKQPSVWMVVVSSLVVHPRVPAGVLRLCGEELLVCCVIHPTVVALFWSLLLVKVVVVSFWTYQCLFLLYCYRQGSRQLCQHKCVVLHASSYLCL